MSHGVRLHATILSTPYRNGANKMISWTVAIELESMDLLLQFAKNPASSFEPVLLWRFSQNQLHSDSLIYGCSQKYNQAFCVFQHSLSRNQKGRSLVRKTFLGSRMHDRCLDKSYKTSSRLFVDPLVRRQCLFQ